MKLKVIPKNKSHKSKFSLGLLCTFFLCIGIYLGWQNLPGFIKANFVLLRDSEIIPAYLVNNKLDTLYLNIEFKDYMKIQEKRMEAIQNQRLVSTKDDFVKAEISLNKNKEIKCEIRLKGHLSDHWVGDKYSLRVNIKKDKLLKGMSSFSIQDPITRSDTLEWIFLNHLREEGCMSLRYDFVNLVINGKSMGIYALEEHFSKEMIEANKRRPGVIGYFDDYFYWKKYPPTFLENISWDSVYLSAAPSIREAKKVQKNPALEKQARNTVELMRSLREMSLPASKILNHDETGKYLAITRLWATQHGLGIDDINFFFNPVTCLLEPIGFDGQSGSTPYKCFFSSNESPWVKYALQDPLIASSYIGYLTKFCSEEYLQGIKDKLLEKESYFRKLLLKEMLWQDRYTIWKKYESFSKSDPWQQLLERVAKIKKELSETRLISGHSKFDNNTSQLTLFVRNTTTQPVEIKAVGLGREVVSGQDIFRLNPDSSYFQTIDDSFVLHPLTASQSHTPRFVRLHLGNFHYPEQDFVQIESRFWGDPEEPIHIPLQVETDSFDYGLIPLAKLKPQLDGLDFEISDAEILIKEGNFTVKNSLFIPAGFSVVISPGTSISFPPDSTFVSESPIFALGTKDKPIHLSSILKSWAGMLLHNTKHCSKLNWLNISNIHGVGKSSNPLGEEMNGWNMTGGITVYKSAVELKNCQFENFQTEDALNIISSSFTIENCTFKNTFSDAFDGDFVRGQINGCSFSNIKGDGIDFSGSLTIVENCYFNEIEDKAISVGEKSLVTIKNCEIDTVSFGVVSKDSSLTVVEMGTIVKNAKTAAFAAFQKKDAFGPATIKVVDSSIQTSKKNFLVQKNSNGSFEGNSITSTDFEASNLYSK